MENVFGKIAQRYAASLFEVAHETTAVREIWAQLGDIQTLLKDNQDLQKFFSNPLISAKEKQAVSEKILKEAGMSDTIIRFVDVLIENNRTILINRILYFYGQRAQESFHTLTAHVYSVKTLSEPVKKVLSEYLKSIFKNDVELICSVTPEILGGLVIKVHNQVMDFSIKHELNRIKEVLKQEG